MSAAPGGTALPTAALDGLRFKTTQLLEAIQSLLIVIDRPDVYTPTWPEVLAKYNVILSLSASLSRNIPQSLHNLALHPTQPVAEAALDSELSGLLRTQQTFQVLESESAVVRRVQGVLAATNANIDTVRAEHDARVQRAQRAVQMLREKFDWKARVEVPAMGEEEEAEDEPQQQQHQVYRPPSGSPIPGLLGLGPGDVAMNPSAYATMPNGVNVTEDGDDHDDDDDEDDMDALDQSLDQTDPMVS
ncbi:hypothetical protein AURDEDRAFT_179712 [Auricularia subglabra TFB-10046 SS5]|nr:hypothetical protein AURDEDRAFT_179712 [Auricularia subglabra TFB-10046 SS5]